MPSPVPLHAQLQRTDGLLSTDLDGETIFLHPDGGRYLCLEGTAREIWQLLEEPRTTAELLEILSGRYRIAHDRLEADVLPFIGNLVDDGLLTAR